MAGAGLQVTVSATNRGSRPAPYGTGQHPYFTAGPAALDEWELELPAARWLPLDERGIPSGPPEDIGGTPVDFRDGHPIGATVLDHALTGDWKGWRDCHVEPDWVLIYKRDSGTLILGRTGTHADLGLE